MVKVRQVLERKTETVTSTFATRMLSIDQCVIQSCLLLSENSNYILYGIVTHKKVEITVNCIKNSAFCFCNFMMESDKLCSCMKLIMPKHSMSQ